jgi:NADPH:quinone reductase-like Zn-dependent oxidoreductase
MQAIHVSKDGGADVLELVTVPIPEVSSPYDILVKLHACALNPVYLHPIE